MSEAVFRFFNSADRCRTYLNGLWKGEGMHGLSESPVQWRPSLDLESGEAEVRVAARLRQPKEPLLRRLAGFSMCRASGGTSGSGFRLEDVRFVLSEGEYEADFACLRSNGHALKIQVLENVKLHCVLESQGALYFSGVLE